MEENIDIKYPKILCFDFELSKDVVENLKRKTEFIIKSNKSLEEIMIKNEIEQLLLKYKQQNK